MKVNILGTLYTIERKKYDDDELFKKNRFVGYCDGVEKKIVLCEAKTIPGFDNETDEYCQKFMKETLRHEIVHAFFNESGLSDSSNQYDGPWPKNEEMIDWMAIQGPKLYKAWEQAKAV